MTTGLSRYPEPAEADSSAPLKTFPANQKKCKIGVRTGCEILSSGSGGLGVQKVNLRLTVGYALNPRTRLTTAAPNTHEPSSAHGDFPSPKAPIPMVPSEVTSDPLDKATSTGRTQP
jgi:hypothetical protein